ncbi:MAG: hypothetical protein AB7L84_14905 [Acidimicrobiia bacterium]
MVTTTPIYAHTQVATLSDLRRAVARRGQRVDLRGPFLQRTVAGLGRLLAHLAHDVGAGQVPLLLRLGDRRLELVVGDVVGHGVGLGRLLPDGHVVPRRHLHSLGKKVLSDGSAVGPRLDLSRRLAFPDQLADAPLRAADNLGG